MADAWGGSWGTSWGISWGSVIAPPQEIIPDTHDGVWDLSKSRRYDEEELKALVEEAFEDTPLAEEPRALTRPKRRALVRHVLTRADTSGIDVRMAQIERLVRNYEQDLLRQAQDEEDAAVVLLLH
jgi:hypothetical protein